MSDHTRYQDDIGAYLLGALNDLERQAFERHLTGCSECRDELERLRQIERSASCTTSSAVACFPTIR